MAIARSMNFDAKQAARDIVAGDRRALARAITLTESTRADHRAHADELLTLLAQDRTKPPSFRIGITGTPGVGKSTLIEAFGLHLCQLGHRVAVLAVDPSSSITGGSILGDKTRMAELSRHPNAYIRPTPAGGTLGGVARRTRDVVGLVEAGGYDLVLIETVGVGQSETAVAKLSDAFVLLVSPAGGDELQGVKRGIMELADLIVVNKCDGDLRAQAQSTLSQYSGALRLMRPTSSWTPIAITASAYTGDGIATLWEKLTELNELRTQSGEFDARRSNQIHDWLWCEISEAMMDRLKANPRVAGLEQEVRAGRRTIASAVSEIVGN